MDDSAHVPPFRQGYDPHSFTSVPQLKSLNPAPHTQPYANTASTHVDPFLHGYDEHSSMSISQWFPAQPFAHAHEYVTWHAALEHLPSEHVAPLMHGDDEHSRMFVHFLPPLAVS